MTQNPLPTLIFKGLLQPSKWANSKRNTDDSLLHNPKRKHEQIRFVNSHHHYSIFRPLVNLLFVTRQRGSYKTKKSLYCVLSNNVTPSSAQAKIIFMQDLDYFIGYKSKSYPVGADGALVATGTSFVSRLILILRLTILLPSRSSSASNTAAISSKTPSIELPGYSLRTRHGHVHAHLLNISRPHKPAIIPRGFSAATSLLFPRTNQAGTVITPTLSLFLSHALPLSETSITALSCTGAVCVCVCAPLRKVKKLLPNKKVRAYSPLVAPPYVCVCFAESILPNCFSLSLSRFLWAEIEVNGFRNV